MTTFQQLPARVVDLIIHYYYEYENAKRNRDLVGRVDGYGKLASVCKSMRKAALPYYHKTLVFQYTQETPYRDEDDEEPPPPPPELEGTGSPWKTNIKQVALECRMDSITELVIVSVYDFMMPLEIIDALKKMNFHMFKWNNIDTLRVYQGQDMQEEYEPSEWVTEDSLTKLGEYLSTNLPAVRVLDSTDTQGGRLDLLHTMSAFLKLTISQLTRFRTCNGNNPVFGVRDLPPQITHLDITRRFTVEALMLPRMFAPSLKVLHLQMLPLTYIWDHFYTNDRSSQELEFTSLESFVVSFYRPREAIIETEEMGFELDAARRNRQRAMEVDPAYTELKPNRKRPTFPVLRRLWVLVYTDHKVSDFLDDFPSAQIQDLRLNGALNTFKSLNLHRYTSLQRLEMIYDAGDRRRELPHIRRLWSRVFSIGHRLQYLKLYQMSSKVVAFPSTSTCTGLIRLQIGTALPIGVAQSLLNCLPRLELMDLHSLIIDNDWMMSEKDLLMRAVEVAKQPASRLGCVNLLHLAIQFQDCRPMLYESALAVTLLVLKIPSLEVLDPRVFKFAEYLENIRKKVMMLAIHDHLDAYQRLVFPHPRLV
ncbi:hypothetical protein FBU59_001957 [Linderina macrospora]|uniref:Uncharacterized protein n=1 Tax=Linderina macrospora TaxID=4868 RepID=A0ACC1JCI7_9FUNG|nr:hypothetical protein FBU59_001957 [Linderina macrospora]